jgi:hypothetical protein
MSARLLFRENAPAVIEATIVWRAASPEIGPGAQVMTAVRPLAQKGRAKGHRQSMSDGHVSLISRLSLSV